MPLNPALANTFVRQELAREVARLDAYQAEARRYAGIHFSGMEPQKPAFRTVEQCIEDGLAAERRANEPDAVLIRQVLALANVGSYEAERVYAASCRGDANWRDRAGALLEAQTQKAA